MNLSAAQLEALASLMYDKETVEVALSFEQTNRLFSELLEDVELETDEYEDEE